MRLLSPTGGGSLFFLDGGRRETLQYRMFPVFDPRMTDLVLGLAIGLSFALAWHWVAWTIH